MSAAGYRVPRFKCALVRDRSVVSPIEKIESAGDAARLFFKLLAGLPCEELHVAYLDNQNAIRGVELIARGGMASLCVTSREIFRGAILANAAAIVLAHNHPSGDPTPSPDDVRMTRDTAEAGRIIGIQLLDHLVVCPERRTFRSIDCDP